MRSKARAFVDADPVFPLGQTRTRVLEVLRAAGGPLDVRDLARATSLHPNTARFHLDGLVQAGLAGRTAEGRTRPGRPRTVYTSLPAGEADGAAGRRSFRLLAEMLTSVVVGALPEAVSAATEAGREWGRYLVERPAPSRRADADQAMRQLLDVLDDIGFAPEVAEEDGNRGTRDREDEGGRAESGGHQIRLHHCPFREVAESNRDVVCGLHLGLMQGMLTELRAPLTTDRLDPFVRPSLCLAHLSDRPDDPDPAGSDPVVFEPVGPDHDGRGDTGQVL